MKKHNYAAMFTLRKDGRYMGYYHELDKDGQPTGPRRAGAVRVLSSPIVTKENAV